MYNVKKDDIRIGFIIATYKRPEMLKRALESIINENYRDTYIAIIDDDPKNQETYREICNIISNKNILYVQNLQNYGLPKTRNIGIGMLSDKVNYIVFLDDDDYIINGAIKKILELLNNHRKQDWYLCPVKFNKNDSTYIKKYLQENDYVLDYALGTNIKGDAAHIISTRVINNIRFHTNKGNHNEFTFFNDLGKKTKIFTLPIPLIKYNYQLAGLTYLKYYDTSSKQIWTRLVRIYYNINWISNLLKNWNRKDIGRLIIYFCRKMIKDTFFLAYSIIVFITSKILGRGNTSKVLKRIIQFIKGKKLPYSS